MELNHFTPKTEFPNQNSKNKMVPCESTYEGVPFVWLHRGILSTDLITDILKLKEQEGMKNFYGDSSDNIWWEMSNFHQISICMLCRNALYRACIAMYKNQAVTGTAAHLEYKKQQVKGVLE